MKAASNVECNVRRNGGVAVRSRDAPRLIWTIKVIRLRYRSLRAPLLVSPNCPKYFTSCYEREAIGTVSARLSVSAQMLRLNFQPTGMN